MKINRNILWTSIFVKELENLGVRYACISPGSRNTPLTIAFANSSKIKSFVHVDERVSGFFALGLARSSASTVALVCTSGTAVAELYPSIIEAYKQRIPLLICTADRPSGQNLLGANQSINQNNIYKNHIRLFYDFGLPDTDVKSLINLRKKTQKAFGISSHLSRGPVHLNFPFEKPFEPDSFTDIIDDELINTVENARTKSSLTIINSIDDALLDEIIDSIISKPRGLIIAGPEHYNPLFPDLCSELSKITGYPIFADGASQLRFGDSSKKNVVSNFDAFLRSNKIAGNIKPQLILHFGRAVTSKSLEDFLAKQRDVPRYLINEFGDWFDPSNNSKVVIAYLPYMFCEQLLSALNIRSFKKKNNDWVNRILKLDANAIKAKDQVIHKSSFINEPKIIIETLNAIPSGSNLMISNSMPIRDFDYFAEKTNKHITVYNNRGASGIDGILSTALGIAAASNKHTFLLIGDLAFYYDINSLLTAKNYKIPLTVILVNNNGGGIFEILPISRHKEVFHEFFKTELNIDFKPIVKGFGGYYSSVTKWEDLHKEISNSLNRKKISILECKTDAKTSLQLRMEYWASINGK